MHLDPLTIDTEIGATAWDACPVSSPPARVG